MKISELLNKIDIPKDDDVYYPSDDSFLYLDYLDSELFLKDYNNIINNSINSKKKDIDQTNSENKIEINILDMGTGTGILGFCTLYKILSLIANSNENIKNFKVNVDFVDINSKAIRLSQKLMEDNINFLYDIVKVADFERNVDINFINSNLLDNLDMKKRWDFNIFNPPYLPSEDTIIEGKNKKTIDWSWDGGSDSGNRILIKFFANIKDRMKKSANIYFITSSFANIKELTSVLYKKNLQFELLTVKHVFFEDIILFKVFK